MRKLEPLPRPVHSRLGAALAALGLLAVLVAALAPSPSAAAKPPAKTITDIFAVAYDAKVTYQHHLALPEYRETQSVTYNLHERLREVTFVDGLLQVDKSAPINTTVKGKATIEAEQDDGDRLDCEGTEIKLRGIVGIGRDAKGIWFVPAHSAAPQGTCVSTEGAHPPFDLTVPWAGVGNGLTAGPNGAARFPVTPKSIDVPSWSKPFRFVFADEKCPNYDPSMTISCSYVIAGKLTLTRVDRTEEVNGEVLLPALDPPQLNKAKTKATTTIECQSGCDVEALIGVFGGTAKHPKVTPLHKRKVHLPADRPTTITMPVTAADRAAAKQGLLVMTLRAAGGKQQVYPLALGGLPNAPGISARRGGTAPAAPGGTRNLILPQTASLRGGSVTLPVSNPNGFRARGSLELRLGKRSLGRTPLAIPAHDERKLTVKIDAAGRAALAQRKAPRVTAVLSFRDQAGHLRRTTRTIVLAPAPGGAPTPNTPKDPTDPMPETPAGPDGAYKGADGLTMIVAGGKVTSFNGRITTYCTTAEEQKSVAFGMFGDDPAPVVASDGSFAYEATTNYGFVKLKYEGRLSGDTAAGKLVVEDRSPISTDDGRLDFDYCFAGADWSATR
jgi:hypothetical protein